MPPRRRKKCPTPSKVALRDAISAQLVILSRQNTAHRRQDTEDHFYQCVCGWWHTSCQRKKVEDEL